MVTVTKLRKLSVDHRVGYHYDLLNVSSGGTDVLRTPFKKILYWLITTTSQVGDNIIVTTNTESTGPGNPAYLTLNCTSDNSDGEIIVVGLL